MGSNGRIPREQGHQPRVRYINGLTIFFATKQAIYVTDGKVAIVLDAWRMAERYEVCRHQAFHVPTITKETIVIKEDK